MSEWFFAYGFADVHPDLLIGAYPLDVGDVRVLERLGVKHILNLVEDDEYEPGQRSGVETAFASARIDETRLRLVDHGGIRPSALEVAVQQVLSWLRGGTRTYVHCRAGWQRSATVAAGVIAIENGLDIEEALALVQARKPSANPLPRQREDLMRWWEERPRLVAHMERLALLRPPK